MSIPASSEGLTGPAQSHPVAVIDIGTASIRMAIAEIDDLGGVRTLEELTQAVNLGRDTFTIGMISKATIEDSVEVLKKYRRTLQEYQITDPEQIRVVATSAVREASNRLAFVDRIYIATGFKVEPIDEAEVNRVTYLGTQPFLEADPTLKAARTVITEVGGGSTELLVVRQGNVTYSHTFRLGSVRLRRTLESVRTSTGKIRSIMERQIQKTVEQLTKEPALSGPLEMIALGGDVRFAVGQLQPDWDPTVPARVPTAALGELTDQLLELTEDEIVRRYHLSFFEAETVGPALLVYVFLAQSFELEHVLVTDTNLRDGLLQEMAVGGAWSEEFRNQIARAAVDLGRRFDFDEDHARHVAGTCQLLFRELKSEHQLDDRHEVVLYVAALLHEIGAFISHRSMHKHSLYIIRNSELFGLSKHSLLLVALVARYHRRASPQPSHEGFGNLDWDERVTVAKLAALLRVAVALDDSRSQRIGDVKCDIRRDRLVISVPGVEDLSLEQLALKQSGSLFEETFGLPVVLRGVRG